MSEAKFRAGLAEVAKQLASTLAKADMLDGRAYIRTPVLFPSGSTVVVVIEDEGGGRYRLTDLAQGHDEADLMGVAATYRRQASKVASLSGLALVDHAFVLPGIERNQLIAATMALANAPTRALERALARGAGRQKDAAVDKLLARLKSAFPRAEVKPGLEISGASTHAWDVDAVVTTDRGRAVFDLVSPSPISVAFAATKFHDIARLDPPPARIAVVRHKASFGDLLAVVAQAARVIEEDASDRAFVRAAEAA